MTDDERMLFFLEMKRRIGHVLCLKRIRQRCGKKQKEN
jgi:hypothetical protein